MANQVNRSMAYEIPAHVHAVRGVLLRASSMGWGASSILAFEGGFCQCLVSVPRENTDF